MKIDGVLDSNYVQEFIRDSPRSPFKTVGGTEKPDVVAACLLEGRVDLDAYFREQAGYVSLLRTWLTAIQCWDKVMFGTDWPIVNLGEYIGFVARLVPEPYHEAVFFDNANRIYGLGL